MTSASIAVTLAFRGTRRRWIYGTMAVIFAYTTVTNVVERPEGIKIASQPRQMELVPYATTRSKLERAQPGDPYHSTNEMIYRAGGDLKLNLTSNLTLDATVNPDFGQVEVDPAVVNLSVFETTFSEKRPFFVSNSQYFSTGGFSCYFCSNVSSLSLVYTRRIGRSPQLAGLIAGQSDFMDAADATTILGAGKVTGSCRR